MSLEMGECLHASTSCSSCALLFVNLTCPHPGIILAFPRFSSSNGPSEYISSLLSEISSLRDEVAAVYRTQSQNAQRLLSMTETLRDKEELLRIENENVRKAREELVLLRRKVETHEEIMSEKDRGVQVSIESDALPSKRQKDTNLDFRTLRFSTTKSNHLI